MDVSLCSSASVTAQVFGHEFKVITPPGLSHWGQGEAVYPDLLTHHIFPFLLPSHLPVTVSFLLLLLLKGGLSDCWSDLLPVESKPCIPISSWDLRSLPLLPINLFSQLTCEGCMKANEGKWEIISHYHNLPVMGKMSVWNVIFLCRTGKGI